MWKKEKLSLPAPRSGPLLEALGFTGGCNQSPLGICLEPHQLYPGLMILNIWFYDSITQNRLDTGAYRTEAVYCLTIDTTLLLISCMGL